MRILLRDHVNKGFTEPPSLLQDVFDFDPFDNSASRTMFTSFVYPSRFLPVLRSFSLSLSLCFSVFQSIPFEENQSAIPRSPLAPCNPQPRLPIQGRYPRQIDPYPFYPPSFFSLCRRCCWTRFIRQNGSFLCSFQWYPSMHCSFIESFQISLREINRDILLFNFIIFNFFMWKVDSFRGMVSSTDVF